MAYSDFDKLKAFFLALKQSRFHPEKIGKGVTVNGQWAPIDKAECFKLLKEKVPELKDKDDAYIAKYLSDPKNVAGRIFAEFVPAERNELEKTLTDESTGKIVFQGGGEKASLSQEGPPAAGSASSGAPFSMPSFGSASLPRIIRSAPQAPQPPKPEITIASSSGHVTEAGDSSKLVKATSGGQIKEAGEPSKLVTATSSGHVREAGSPSKLVTTHGGVIKEPPPSKIFIANKQGLITGTKNIRTPGFLKNFGSKVNIGLNKGINKAIGGINNFSLGGGAGGSKSFFGRFSRFGGRASTGGAKSSLSGKLGGGKKFALAGSLFFFLFFMAAMIGAGMEITPTGGTTPPPPGTGTPPAPPPAPPPGPPKPPPAADKLRDSLISEFDLTMNGFGEQWLRWTWEKLTAVSGTRFVNFIRGSTVQAVAQGDSEQVGCPGSGTTVKLGAYPDEELFKLVFIHEFGHVIRNCPNSQSNYYAEHDNAYTKEGGVSYYARNAAACTGSDNKSEDYADMIAYYLNPNTTRQTARCSPENKNPNLKINFPLHYNTARSILGDYN